MRMKKCLNTALFIVILFIICATTGNVLKSETSFSIWNGSEAENPVLIKAFTYEIRSASQLVGLARTESFTEHNTYLLKTNIDLAGHEWAPIGGTKTGDQYIDGKNIRELARGFRGVFDGGGYSIKGLKLPNGSTTGLFGYICGTEDNKTVIKNLTIELFSNVITETETVGALVGYAEYAEIENISVSGEKLVVKAPSLALLITGGVVGFLHKSNISRSSCVIEVRAESSTSGVVAGGLVGTNSGTIASSYATGNVISVSTSNVHYYSGFAEAGGIAGSNNSNARISSCYASGDVIAISKSQSNQAFTIAGGITGSANTPCIIERCAALNKNVTAAKCAINLAARIAVPVVGESSFVTNIANENMKVIQGERKLIDLGAVNHGSGLKFETLTDESVYLKLLKWDENIWIFPQGEYPKFK